MYSFEPSPLIAATECPDSIFFKLNKLDDYRNLKLYCLQFILTIYLHTLIKYCFAMWRFSYCTTKLSKHTKPAYNLGPLPARQRNAIQWRFAGGSIVAHYCMLRGSFYLTFREHKTMLYCESVKIPFTYLQQVIMTTKRPNHRTQTKSWHRLEHSQRQSHQKIENALKGFLINFQKKCLMNMHNLRSSAFLTVFWNEILFGRMKGLLK